MRSAAKWPVLPLTEAFWFQEGPGVRNWQFTTSGIKLLNVANIEKDGTLNLEKTDRHLDESEVAKKYSHFIIDAGDLVIASSGISFDDDGLLRTRGAFVRSDQLPLCLNTSTIRFKAIDGISDLRFLRFWLDSREFRSQITKLVTGTAQQNFGPSHLKATKISIPPLPEQRRIAEILDKADALRAKRRAALAQLDTLTQSIFLDMFGDPATNPKGWKKTSLEELFEIARGGSPRPIDDYITDAPDGINWIMIGDTVEGGKYIAATKKRIRPEGARRSRAVKPGDFLLTNSMSFGRPYILRTTGCIHDGWLVLSPRSEEAEPNYFYALLGSKAVYAEFARRAPGATVKNLNIDLVRDVIVPVPPLPAQRKFAALVATIERSTSTFSNALVELDALFSSLQHRAFQGNL